MATKALNIEDSLAHVMKIDGAVGAALVEYTSGMCLGSVGGGGFDMELAAAGNSEVVRAKKAVKEQLGINEEIEDILITLESQYHLIRIFKTNSDLFLYLIMDKSKNLALARMKLKGIEGMLEV